MATMATNMEAIISRAITIAVDEAIAEEEERAVQRVRDKIRAQKSTIAMAVLRHFDVSRCENRIVITVLDNVED